MTKLAMTMMIKRVLLCKGIMLLVFVLAIKFAQCVHRYVVEVDVSAVAVTCNVRLFLSLT